ncbi:esterase [Rhodococcus sp. WMMA185]|uniref:alpha/beta fold hydrolase n=1 Tax=Rhodococcus sp. WMMA185 TaxID=679318 RepID=UPI000878864B|nr:alpha/beta fold hydrolase [Rhodococcus sp. WMMA185]AOW94674.1 esterase [Rhodococcus sp. WMMA185]
MTQNISRTHIVLVPGFWLGDWAWDAVANDLNDRGHRVTAVTPPGLESSESDRSTIGLDDHIAAVVAATATTATDQRTVLVAHSGSGPVVYGASDRVPERIDRIVYVDSGPLQNGTALRPDLEPSVTEIPLPSWSELEADGNSLDGLDDVMLRTFRARAVPHPAGPARDALELTNPRRVDVQSTVICTSFPSEAIAQMVTAGHPMVAELARLTAVEYVDLPTGHWPMWSRPTDLAAAIDAAAR